MFKRQQFQLTIAYTLVITTLLALSGIGVFIAVNHQTQMQLRFEIERLLDDIEDSEWRFNEKSEGPKTLFAVAFKDDSNKEDSDDKDKKEDSDEEPIEYEEPIETIDSIEDKVPDETDDSKETDDSTEDEEPAIELAPLTIDEIVIPKSIAQMTYFAIYDNSKRMRFQKKVAVSPASEALSRFLGALEVNASPIVYKANAPVPMSLIAAKRTLVVGNQVLGTFTVARDVTMVNNTLNLLSSALIWIFLVGVGLSAIIAYFLAGRALKPIQEAYISQQTFLANASHELKTPISVMLLGTEALVDELNEAAKNDKALDLPNLRGIANDLKEESLTMRHQVNQLLLLAKSDAAKLKAKVEWTSVQLDQLIVDQVQRHEALAQEKEIHLSITAEHPVQLMGSSAQLSTLMGILIENAIKYTPRQGSVQASLHISKSPWFWRNEVTINIDDSGLGIPPKERHRVFERYYRIPPSGLQSTTSSESGHGLGLSIAQEIVAAHGGRLFAGESPLGGARFTLTLPLFNNNLLNSRQ